MAVTRWSEKSQALESMGCFTHFPSVAGAAPTHPWREVHNSAFPDCLWWETGLGQVGLTQQWFPVVPLPYKRTVLGEDQAWIRAPLASCDPRRESRRPASQEVPSWHGCPGQTEGLWVCVLTHPVHLLDKWLWWQFIPHATLSTVDRALIMALMVESQSDFSFTINPDGCCLHFSHLCFI